MDSINRIFGLVNEAKKAKGKGKAMIPPHKETPGGEKTTLGQDNPYDHDHMPKKGKVNASTEIVNILNLIKEAYQDELISEEAFLAIADPILRSLMEVKYEGTEKKGTVTAGPKGRTQEFTGPKAERLYAAARRRLTSQYGSEVGNPPKGTSITYSKK